MATPRVKLTEVMRAALGDGFLYVLYFQEPGVAERELDADLRRTLAATLYGISGDVPRDQFRFFDPSAQCFFDVVRDPPGPLDWLSDDDLEVFVDSFRHHGTFAGGLNWYRNIDRNQELLAAFGGRQVEQPALFIGAEFDAIFGQTPEAVLATRAAVPNLRDPVWIADSGHWIQQEEPDAGQRCAAGVPRLAGLGRSSTLIASAVVASGRPTDATNATACSTSSTLVGLAVGVEVLLEADVQVAAPLEREARHRRGHEVAAPHRHRPREVGALEHVEVGEQRVARSAAARRSRPAPAPTCPTRLRSRASPSSPRAAGRRGGR